MQLFASCVVKLLSQGNVKTTEGRFTSKSFTNWKDAIRIFAKDESSDVHKQSTTCMSSSTDIDETRAELYY